MVRGEGKAHAWISSVTMFNAMNVRRGIVEDERERKSHGNVWLSSCVCAAMAKINAGADQRERRKRSTRLVQSGRYFKFGQGSSVLTI